MNRLREMLPKLNHEQLHKRTSKPEYTDTTPSLKHICVTTSLPQYAQLVQSFFLLWLDGNIDGVHDGRCSDTIAKLQLVVNTVNTFADANKCIDFINDIKEEKVFVISSGTLGQTTVPIIHNKPQISTIYIFCGNKDRYETWAKKWPKIKGVFTDIESICEELIQAVQDCDQNMASISFIKLSDETSKENFDQPDQSFIYIRILKEILLTIDFKQEHVNKFFTYCCEQLAGNPIEFENVEKLKREYYRHQPIRWYTYDCFLYSMLNRALRTMEVDLIIKMGFFVRDLYQNIAALHSEQYGRHHHELGSFTVFRGQGLSQIDFDQLLKAENGLLSFNNFLLASKKRNISLNFARRTMATSNLVGVLFIMNIDPSISTISFINVRDVSAYQSEEEILFTMHSVFVIGQIKQIEEKDRLWQVDLTLIRDNDVQLHALTENMNKELKGSTGWLQLSKLMIKLGHFNKAEDLLYEMLFQQLSNKDDKLHLLHQHERVNDNQVKFRDAIEFYETLIQMKQKIHPSTHPDLTASYRKIGSVYKRMGEYRNALSYYQKALDIDEKTLPSNHCDLAISYDDIGNVYDKMGEYSEAISYYEKVLEIKQKTLPSNHSDVAKAYSNIAEVYFHMDDHLNALPFIGRAVDIGQHSLSQQSPELRRYKALLEIIKKKL